MDDNPEVATPHVRSGRSKALSVSADQTYRSYEAASESNAQQAADMLGVPVSEMANLKITNMDTQLREGDVAVRPVNNEVSRFMDSHPGVVQNMQSPEVAMGYASAAHAGGGKDAYAGARAAHMLRELHQKSGGATSAVPTLEKMKAGGGLTF
jgi:hypothetical protein